MENSVFRNEKMTPEKLLKFYKPPGKRIPEERWEEILTNSVWPTKSSKIAVHVILSEGDQKEKIALVVNPTDRDREGKMGGIGFPTKEIINGKTPFETAKLTVANETNLREFQIADKPISIRKNSREIIHIIFRGNAKFPPVKSKIVKDPDKGVWKVYFIDPFRSIRIEFKGNGERIYKPVLDGRYVFKTHLGFLSEFLFG